MKTAYLAGAMEFAHDGGLGWRSEMTQWLARELGHGTLDPTVLEHDQLTDAERASIVGLKQSNPDAIRPLARRIVEYDVRLVLEKADYLIVLWDAATQAGCGTAGEITVAAWAGKPVHLLLDFPRSRASTWMIGCTTSLHEDMAGLKAHLKATYGSRNP